MIPLLFAVALLACPELLHSADVQDSACLPFSELALSGVALGDAEKKVLRHLGKPRKVLKETHEDGAGAYILTTFHYPDVNVDVVRGIVIRLFTSSPNAMTPSGIKTGQTHNQVFVLLGLEMNTIGQSKKTIHVLKTCPDAGQARSGKMKLMFNENRILSTIEIRADR